MADIETGEYLHAPEIAVIGGGTGSFAVLQELKEFTPHIHALVNMTDDGGSTGRLRDELGVLPPGDARQCLVALSDVPDLRDLVSYRFPGRDLPEEDEGLAGHTVGNILLSAAEMQTGSFAEGMEMLGRVLRIRGEVVPITLDKSTVMLRDGDEIIEGEFRVGHDPIKDRGAEVYLDPPVELNPDAKKAILESDIVVIAPGNLYGSLIPALATTGIREAFAETEAKKVMIANLVTKPGQTDNWHVADYLHAVERYVGEGAIDRILFNNQPPPRELLDKYAADGEYPVDINEEKFRGIGAVAIGEDFVSDDLHEQDPGDRIQRTLIRHDGRRVGRALMRIYYE